MKASIQSPRLSLSDLLGREYTKAVCAARAFASSVDVKQKVAFFPGEFQKRVDELIDAVGKQVCPGFKTSACGATTDAFTYLETKGKKHAWARVVVGHKPMFPSITGGIFEFGFSDGILQMWASYLHELDGREVSFGCSSMLGRTPPGSSS